MLRAGSRKITIFGSPSSECGYSLTPAERQQRFIDRKRRLALYRHPPAQQEGVANDLRLLLQPVAAARFARRSDERRVRKECVSTCRYRCSPEHQQKNISNRHST